jgi:hypothetical protein
LLDSFAPRSPTPAGDGAEDVSSAVLITLLVVLAAAFVFAGSVYLPWARRLLDPRTWRRG